jgi:hypothetical protein
MSEENLSRREKFEKAKKAREAAAKGGYGNPASLPDFQALVFLPRIQLQN